VILSYFNGSLLKVAALSSLTVFVFEWLIGVLM
jgi:hypothetical protein